jgi:hypothetical protein
MIYDKHAYKIVVVISSHTDEFFLFGKYIWLFISALMVGITLIPWIFQRNESFQNPTA